MTKITKSVHIPRPVDEVFAYLADFSNTAEWDPGVAEATRIGEGPMGVGSRFELVALFRGRRVPVTYEVTEYDPSRRVVLVGRNRRFTGTDDIRLAPDNGGTRVSWNANFEMKGLARILTPFLKSVFDELSDAAMEGLEKTLSR